MVHWLLDRLNLVACLISALRARHVTSIRTAAIARRNLPRHNAPSVPFNPEGMEYRKCISQVEYVRIGNRLPLRREQRMYR